MPVGKRGERMSRAQTIACGIISSILLAVLTGSEICYADTVETTGKATVDYTSSAFSSKPNDESKRAAVEKAKKVAWEHYTAKFDSAKMQKYKEVEAQIVNDLDKYVVEFSIVDELIDKESKRYTVVISASINVAAFEETMRGVSAAGSAPAGSGAQFAFVFVAREKERVLSFDAKRMVVSDQEATERERQDEAVSAEGVTTAGAHHKKTTISTTGGSTEKKADQIAYRILSAADVSSAMSDVLTNANFNVVNYVDVANECHGIELRVIQEGFVKTNELTADVRSSVFKAARDCEVSYFAVGTLDSEMADVDPVTGNQRVFVSVSAQVWNIEKRLPTTVAVVEPQIFSGLGPDAEVARRKGLKLAAKKAAQTIVSQLNAKGVR